MSLARNLSKLAAFLSSAGQTQTAGIADANVTPAKLSTGAPAWDANGNMALNGATPSPWESAWKAFDIGALGGVAYGYGEVNFLNNLYRLNTGAYKYKITGTATVYTQSGSSHNFGSFASGSAGATATIVPLLTFDKDKTLALQGATSVTGTGLSFPATQSASSDANTLDDYEEGTWTPSLISDGTNPTVSSYSTRTGSYTKVGNLVTATCYIRATISSIGTGIAVVSGLPFSSGGYLDGVSLGIRDILSTTLPTFMYVAGANVVFNATYSTAANTYLTFTVSYRVA